MRDRLEPQHAFAFGIRLAGQPPEVQLEHGQVVARCLDRGLDRRGVAAGAAGPLRGPEDGADLGHIQPGACAIHHGVKHPLHRRAVGEDQVATVLELIDGEPVNKPAAALLVEIQPEAQARGIDPALADLAQPPYSRILRQGICDPGQARRVGDRSEAVAGLAECYPRRGSLPCHELVAVEDDLRAERRMPRHLDRDMAPLGVDDVKRIVVDVFAPPLDVHDRGGLRRARHLPHRRRRLGHQHQKHPDADLMAGQVRLGDAVLALPGRAEDHRHPVGRTPRLDPPREPARHSHQVRVVQLGVAVAVPAPPPGAEPARVVPERIERVEHDPIHAVIATGHQIRIPQAELVIRHPLNLRNHPLRVSRNCPKGHRRRAKSRLRRSEPWSVGL